MANPFRHFRSSPEVIRHAATGAPRYSIANALAFSGHSA